MIFSVWVLIMQFFSNIYLFSNSLVLTFKEGLHMLREAGIDIGDEDDLRYEL